MLNRRTLLATGSAAVALASPLAALAQNRKDAIVLGMTLEPTGLDPTTSAAVSISEVTLYNIYETLTKINENGSVTPLLAESWDVSPDLKTYTFRLRKGVKFQNGEPFNAQAVKFSFERAGSDKSTNKDKRTFASIGVQVIDDHTVVLLTKEIDPDFPFALGQATAIIVEPKSADTNAAKPVGTGPYKLDAYNKGASLVLGKWAEYRNPGQAKIAKVTFRFISDAAAQAASLMAGDVDVFPRAGTRIVAQFKNNPQFQVILAGSRAKTILAINNAKKPLDDVRVRRAILAAIDRKAIIDGSQEGLAKPIGSHLVPSDAGYIDLTGANPYDPEKAKALLKEAGVALPLNVTLTLPPPEYARKGGEIVAAQLAKVGIVAKIENVEWAQWLSGTFKGNFDLTMISHVEPLDFDRYADPAYYWGYNSKAYNDLFAKYNGTTDAKTRLKLVGDIQRQLATDSVNVYLYQLPQFAVSKKQLKGLWSSSPVFANDLAALSWQ